MGKKKGSKVPAELFYGEPAVEAPTEEYPCDKPVAEAIAEEPPYDEPKTEALSEAYPCNAPVAEAPQEEYNEPVRDITPVNPYDDSSIEAVPAEAYPCDEPEKAKDTGSDLCVGIAPDSNQPESVKATPPSTRIGDDTHWEKLFVCCAQCTRMVLITTGKVCPFAVLGLDKARNRSSIAMTTCRSCKKANKSSFVGYQAFVDQCTRNFKELRLSPKFLAGSHLYKVAMTVAQDHVNIMHESGGITYVDMDGLLEEMTDDCTMNGVHNDVTKGLIKEELVMPFLPGAFV